MAGPPNPAAANAITAQSQQSDGLANARLLVSRALP